MLGKVNIKEIWQLEEFYRVETNLEDSTPKIVSLVLSYLFIYFLNFYFMFLLFIYFVSIVKICSLMCVTEHLYVKKREFGRNGHLLSLAEFSTRPKVLSVH